MILGRFRVERILGHGGMGEVLLAQDTLLHRRVALKRLRSDGAEGTAATGGEGASRRSAVLKEARRASQISDRRIAAIYDVLDFDGDVLIVMEYVDGSTLRERMSGPLAVGEFWNLATECVEAVGAAHAHGLIHRDIKPENLMLTRDGQVKILDFGIARRVETHEGLATAVSTTTTVGGRGALIAGTPQYMAPEAHYGGRIDTRTDIFSLGTVFYELLTARSPYAAPTYEGVLDRVMNTTPEPASEVNRSVGPQLAAVIARMMAKDPAQRHASCEEVARDLEAARTPGGPAAAEAAPRTAAAPRPRAFPRPAVVAAALLLAGGAAFLLLRGSLGASLPAERNLAVLPPRTPGASDDFSSFALGAVELLGSRLQKHQDRAGFQLASFVEGFDEKVASAADARKIQGANLALMTTFEQRTDALRARLELWDTARDRRIASRTVEAPLSQPFAFLDRVHGGALRMLRLPARGGDAASECGIRGAGTLRYLLQGIGRNRGATTKEQARGAVGDLELACNTEPEASVPHAWLAVAQLKCFTLGDGPAWLTQAEASARTAIDRDSSRAEPYRSLAQVLVQRKDLQGALAAFRRARDLNPTDDFAALRLARTYAQLGQTDQEKEAYLATIAARPHCWQPYWWLATCYFRGGQVEEAIHAYRDMIRCAPALSRGYAGLGGILVLQGAYDPAIDTLKISIALRPNRTAFDNLGTACFNSGRLEQAVDAYNQAFQFGFADYGLWLNLGDAYYWLRGRRDQAAEAYTQAVRLGREETSKRAHLAQTFDVLIPANLSTVFPKIGQADSARVYLRRALLADSTNALVQYCAALTCWQLDDRGRAMAWLGKAVQNGYPVAWLRDSPVFEEWRGEGAFRALVAGTGPQTQRSAAPGKGGRT